MKITELKSLKSKLGYHELRILVDRYEISDLEFDKIFFQTGESAGKEFEPWNRYPLFEDMRSKGKTPAPSRNGYTGVIETLDLMYPELTINRYSIFWEFLSRDKWSLEEARTLIIKCVERMDLPYDSRTHYFSSKARGIKTFLDGGISNILSIPELEEFINQGYQDYQDAETIGLDEVSKSLDLITLIALLAVEASHAGSLIFIRHHVSSFEMLLSMNCESLVPPILNQVNITPAQKKSLASARTAALIAKNPIIKAQAELDYDQLRASVGHKTRHDGEKRKSDFPNEFWIACVNQMRKIVFMDNPTKKSYQTLINNLPTKNGIAPNPQSPIAHFLEAHEYFLWQANHSNKLFKVKQIRRR